MKEAGENERRKRENRMCLFTHEQENLEKEKVYLRGTLQQGPGEILK